MGKRKEKIENWKASARKGPQPFLNDYNVRHLDLYLGFRSHFIACIDVLIIHWLFAVYAILILIRVCLYVCQCPLDFLEAVRLR